MRMTFLVTFTAVLGSNVGHREVKYYATSWLKLVRVLAETAEFEGFAVLEKIERIA